LPSKFANFIREENVQDVFLIGPKTIVNCKILISKKHRISTRSRLEAILFWKWLKRRWYCCLSSRQWFHQTKYWSVC